MIVVICDCPFGAVTETVPGSLACTSILYPGGRNVLKPTMSSGCPLNSDETLLMTPGVSILENSKNATTLDQCYKTYTSFRRSVTLWFPLSSRFYSPKKWHRMTSRMHKSSFMTSFSALQSSFFNKGQNSVWFYLSGNPQAIGGIHWY